MNPFPPSLHAGGCEGAEAVLALLEGAVRDGVCTAWSAACKDWFASAFFADEWAPSPGGGAHPVFDLASLTKPLFVPRLLRRFAGNAAGSATENAARPLDHHAWNEPLADFRDRSLREFLDHESGAAAWFWMGEGGWVFRPGDTVARARFEDPSLEKRRAHAREVLLHRALGALSEERRGTSLYSDVNYFLLARAFENLAAPAFQSGGEAGSFDWSAALAALNALSDTHFQHASLTAEIRSVPFFPYVSTEAESISPHDATFEPFGAAHDTNANILASGLAGLVSGHAGLFGTVADVDRSLASLVEGLGAVCENHGRFVRGLDTPSGPGSTAGLRNFPPAPRGSILGHLGYTGTSFWLERKHQGEGHDTIAKRHILLTNRTASRTRYGSHAPRFLVITSAQGAWVWGGMESRASSGRVQWQELPQSEWHEAVAEGSRGQKVLWNPAVLRAPRDISDLRRSFGLLAW